MRILLSTLTTLLCLSAGASTAATTTYGQQSTFQAAMDLSFGVVDVSTYATNTTTTTISGDFSDVDFFAAPVSFVRGDDLIPNGQGFFGAATPHIGLNFANGVNGVGAFSNAGDGGRIRIFDGLDGTGTFLGQANFGGASAFGGITSDTLIKSAVFTCDFNFDLACGVIDPQWGTGSSFDATVPLPAAGWLLIAGIGGLAAARARQHG